MSCSTDDIVTHDRTLVKGLEGRFDENLSHFRRPGGPTGLRRPPRPTAADAATAGCRSARRRAHRGLALAPEGPDPLCHGWDRTGEVLGDPSGQHPLPLRPRPPHHPTLLVPPRSPCRRTQRPAHRLAGRALPDCPRQRTPRMARPLCHEPATPAGLGRPVRLPTRRAPGSAPSDVGGRSRRRLSQPRRWRRRATRTGHSGRVRRLIKFDRNYPADPFSWPCRSRPGTAIRNRHVPGLVADA